MKKRKIALGLVTASLATVALASCTNSENTRNTTTPYGNLSLDTAYATAMDGEYSLSTQFYYDRLRSKSYDLLLTDVKSTVYADQITAVTKLLKSSAMTDMGDSMDALILIDSTGTLPTTAEKEARYEYLKKNVKKNIEKQLTSNIVGTTDLDTYRAKTESDITKAITKYVESKQLTGSTITASDIEFSEDESTMTVKVNISKLPQDILDEQILTQAANIYTERELYKIADQEYLPVDTDDDGVDDDEEKNSYFIFDADDDSNIESSYNSYDKTYGTYNAIAVQFNTRREAFEAVNYIMNLYGWSEINDTNVADFYLALYNYCNNYRGASFTSTDDDEFIFNVSEDYNAVSELSSSISTLVTDTLKDGEYLVEPRDISDKYIMAYRIKTTYDVGGKDEAIEFEDLKDELSEDEYNALIKKIKTRVLSNSISGYTSTALNDAIENTTIKIYDPYLEYKFYYSYSDEYELIDKNDFDNACVYTIGTTNYTVEDFFTKASAKYGYSIVNTYFEQAYVYQFAEDFLDDDTIDGYSDTLDDAVETFNNNENSTYPSEIGLETYLLASYGYTSKDDVLKYYYTAANTLTNYLAKTIYNEYATDEHTLSDFATSENGILNSILKTGNAKYSTLFNINLDHILINIDDDGDGSPDNPTLFMAKLNEEQKTKFQEAVVDLARAIYTEATYEAYSDNSLYENLTYIVEQYNKGAQLKSDPTKTWDDYKEFHFLLTAEQLASSSDIDQDSVDNFVAPFKEYVKKLYKIADEQNVTVDSEKGIFFAVGDDAVEFAGGEITDASQITYDDLCQTSYGFHLLVLNSYSGPDSLKYTADDDTYSYQSAIEVLLDEGDDEDSDDDNIYVKLNSYNDNSDSASLNQLFIYYIQSNNGDTSSLDSSISTVLSTLFDDVIETYEGTSFQTILLLDLLNIQTSDTVLKAELDTQRSYLVNQVTEYGDADEYAPWCVKGTTEYNFARPASSN